MSDQVRQDGLVATTIALTCISLICILLRIFVRTVVIFNPGHDDWAICVALLAMIAYMVEILIARANHIGFPMATLTYDNMIMLMKVTMAIQATYYVCITAIKSSILLMYLRFTIDHKTRKAIYGLLILHAVFLVICVVVVFCQCRPLHKFWDLIGAVEGHCGVNGTAFFYFTSAFNIITDIVILTLPIKTLIKINRPMREKIALLCLFLVGTFATITSIVRLHTIYTYTLAEDPFRNSILVNLWSVIEINMGIVCANAPALKALFSSKVRRAAASRNKSSSSRTATLPKYGVFSRHGRTSQEKLNGSGTIDRTTTETESELEAWKEDSYPGAGISIRTDIQVGVEGRKEGDDSDKYNPKTTWSSQEHIIRQP